MVFTDNEFALGTIDIELAAPAASDTEEWIPFNPSEWQVSNRYDRQAKIVNKQCTSRRIRASCRYHTNGGHWLRLRLYVNVGPVARATFSNTTQSLQFLELLTATDQRQSLFDNIAIARDSRTISPFGSKESARSLLDIFVHMPSPSRTQIDDKCDAEILKFIDQFLDQPSPAGMKTKLYEYQKRSLWKILQRELAPQKVLQPHIIEFQAVDGTSLYLDSISNVIHTEPPLQDDVAGGIICEDMGTGKTCLCLSVIMATKGLHTSVGNGNILRTDLLKAQETNGPHSLRDIAAAGVLEAGIDWKQWEHNLPKDIVEKMLKHPACYEWCDISPLMLERERRKDVVFPTFDIYPSCATLVIVPNNLVAQWTGEIYKHISDGQLRFLLLDSMKKPVPSAKELVAYDLVLMTESRFASEYSAGGFEFQGISRLCQCPYIKNTRIRDCKCDQKTEKSNYVSPLIQVHWKRIITDEGHRLASHCRQSELATKLFSNWTWICTGTPTPNLTESANAGRAAQSEDFKRLGILLGTALRLQPFKDDKKLWNKLIATPFVEGQTWAVSHLENLLGRIMIRNRKSDIERDVVLPPLYQKQVDLDFDYYQWVAHNCQIAMIGLNAILSKREGPDYLFSKNNVKPLRETVHNLWQSCLWHSIDLKWLQTSYENCCEAIEKVKNGSDDYGEDNPVLYKILETFRIALNDQVFMQMMTKHSPPFLVSGLPPLMKEKWGWAKGDRGVYEPVDGNLMLNDHCIIDGDLVIDLMTDVRSALKENDTKDLYVYNPFNDTLQSVEQGKREDKADGEDGVQKTFYNKNVFTDVKIISSLSSKINYLVDEISKYHKTEKCIIFSQHYNEMQEIYLALQLAKLNPLMYLGRGENAVKSSHTFTTFNTAEGFNVIIMSVQKAAYGINLSSASRVYFVSPVWQTAMEQQAIKRAHRLGQTQPVYVETLVIRNTIEYELLKRRKALGDRQQDSKEFFSDRKLQNILNHATFVPLPSHIKQRPDGSFYQPVKSLQTEIWFIPQEKPAISSPVPTAAAGSLPTPPLASEDILDVEEMDIEEKPLKPTGKKRKAVSFDMDDNNNTTIIEDSTSRRPNFSSDKGVVSSMTEKPNKKAKAKKKVTFSFE